MTADKPKPPIVIPGNAIDVCYSRINAEQMNRAPCVSPATIVGS